MKKYLLICNFFICLVLFLIVVNISYAQPQQESVHQFVQEELQPPLLHAVSSDKNTSTPNFNYKPDIDSLKPEFEKEISQIVKLTQKYELKGARPFKDVETEVHSAFKITQLLTQAMMLLKQGEPLNSSKVEQLLINATQIPSDVPSAEKCLAYQILADYYVLLNNPEKSKFYAIQFKNSVVSLFNYYEPLAKSAWKVYKKKKANPFIGSDYHYNLCASWLMFADFLGWGPESPELPPEWKPNLEICSQNIQLFASKLPHIATRAYILFTIDKFWWEFAKNYLAHEKSQK